MIPSHEAIAHTRVSSRCLPAVNGATNARVKRTLVLGVAILGAAACGGATTPSGPAGSSGDGSSGVHACTEIGCDNGVRIDFSYRELGAYVFEVTIDGTKTTCKATLPLSRQPPTACDRADALLGLIGSMLPVAQQSIGGLTVSSTTAKRIAVRGTRDGTLLGEKTFVPPYVVGPSPNGPGCPPNECTLAKVAFP